MLRVCGRELLSCRQETRGVASRKAVARLLAVPQSVDHGVWAGIKVGNELLRLFSEQNALGVQALVYNANAKNCIAPSESLDDIEQGKDLAAELARLYLHNTANLELPPLKWK